MRYYGNEVDNMFALQLFQRTYRKNVQSTAIHITFGPSQFLHSVCLNHAAAGEAAVVFIPLPPPHKEDSFICHRYHMTGRIAMIK